MDVQYVHQCCTWQHHCAPMLTTNVICKRMTAGAIELIYSERMHDCATWPAATHACSRSAGVRFPAHDQCKVLPVPRTGAKQRRGPAPSQMSDLRAHVGGRCSRRREARRGHDAAAALHHARHQRGDAPLPSAARAHPARACRRPARRLQHRAGPGLLHLGLEPAQEPGAVGRAGSVPARALRASRRLHSKRGARAVLWSADALSICGRFSQVGTYVRTCFDSSRLSASIVALLRRSRPTLRTCRLVAASGSALATSLRFLSPSSRSRCWRDASRLKPTPTVRRLA